MWPDAEEQMKTVARGSFLLELSPGNRVEATSLTRSKGLYISTVLGILLLFVVFHFCCCHLYLLNLLFCFCIFKLEYS